MKVGFCLCWQNSSEGIYVEPSPSQTYSMESALRKRSLFLINLNINLPGIVLTHQGSCSIYEED